ncbi:MAG: MarR family winged helix-turn-helix transcriptional regulator [Hyphomicrobiales bacterium]
MGTHHEGPAVERRALDAYIKIVRGARSITMGLDRQLAEMGLTERQFGVLETLFHLGPLPQCELSRKQLTTGGNITFVVDNLERDGLVERRRDMQDRRMVTVHLTARGLERISDVFPRHAAAVAERLATLDPAEQDELGRLMKKLGRAQADAAAQDEHAAGDCVDAESRAEVPEAVLASRSAETSRPRRA